MDPACRGRSATKRSAATTNAAIEDFVSAAPRPEVAHLAEFHRLAAEARSFEACGEQFLAAAVFRGQRPAGNQFLGQV